MSRAPATDLAGILEHQADLYELLLAVLGEEQAALVAGSTLAVADCVTRKETMIRQLRTLETSRQTVVGQLTGRPEARLADVPGANDGALGQARRRLSELLPRVERTNRRVEALVSRSLARLRLTLELIQHAVGGGREYSAAGSMIGPTRPTVDGRI